VRRRQPDPGPRLRTVTPHQTLVGRAAIIKARKHNEANGATVVGCTALDKFTDIDVALTWPAHVTRQHMQRVVRVVSCHFFSILADAFGCGTLGTLNAYLVDSLESDAYPAEMPRSAVSLALLRDFEYAVRPFESIHPLAPKLQLIAYKATATTPLPLDETTAPAHYDFIATGVVATGPATFINAIDDAQARGLAQRLSMNPLLRAVEYRSLKRVKKYIADGWTLDPRTHLLLDIATVFRYLFDRESPHTDDFSNYDYIRTNLWRI